VKQGWARLGLTWRGMVRHGLAGVDGHGEARQGAAGEAWSGVARRNGEEGCR
jgi:hypothetical protein